MPRSGGGYKTMLKLPPDVDLPTETSIEQRQVLRDVRRVFQAFEDNVDDCEANFPLQREATAQYIIKSLEGLSSGFASLDASRPWLCYWMLNALDILDELSHVTDETLESIVDFLGRCQSPTGGFGGGPGQLAHLASTYAAVNALSIIGTDAAKAVINRDTLKSFLISMHRPDGSFCMHDGGEVDVRGSYCALASASLAGVLVGELCDNTAAFISRCQTYEGGFGAVPGTEAHGGYTFCAVAALFLLQAPQASQAINIQSLAAWVTHRQMEFEGGFQGRTNKLVDGCYSFWQGGLFPLLQALQGLQGLGGEGLMYAPSLMDSRGLQRYILLACQTSGGGLRDKPNKSRDHYHTCYCLTGLSVAQHNSSVWCTVGLHPSFAPCHTCGVQLDPMPLYGCASNVLAQVHPVYGLTMRATRLMFPASQ